MVSERHTLHHSIVTTIQVLVSYRDRNTQLDIMVFDFSKASDTVIHKCLLHKLHHYGIRCEVDNWLHSFLNTGYQCVVVDGEWIRGLYWALSYSSPKPMTPPYLHRVTLPTLRWRLLTLPAIHSLQDHQLIRQDLQHLQHWADDCGRHFDASKGQLLRISRSQHPLEQFYAIRDQILQQVPSAKYLGVLLNDRLKWDTHTDSITARANSTIGFLPRNLSLCTKDLDNWMGIFLPDPINPIPVRSGIPIWRRILLDPVAHCTLGQAGLFNIQQLTEMLDDLGVPIEKA